jgi:cytochrome c2
LNYQNDERYWNISLLNKWFAFAAFLWTLSMIWMFIDDNDDEFKYYQNQYYSILKNKTESDYNELYAEVSDIKNQLELELESKKLILNSQKDFIQSINDSIQKIKDQYAKVTIDWKGLIVAVDVAKYLVEKEKTGHKYNEKSEATLNFNSLNHKKKNLKKEKESLEISMSNFNSIIEQLNQEVKIAEDKRNQELKRLDLLSNQLIKLDRNKMTLGNQIADMVRDLPIIDFLDSKLEVKQTVVSDIKYDVNFATVSTVDRCASCHMGIDDPKFLNENQPHTAHPNLELIGGSLSPHPFNEFGCTSCHSGRSRGTGFSSTVHMPFDTEEKKDWEEKYDWEMMHHWLQPMFPSEYSQAGCFKCHTEQPYLKGAEKLQLGITLIKKNGCNACHYIEDIPKDYNIGPDLTQVNKKFNKEWAFKWIKNPQSFRYDTKMPHFFEQDNNSSPSMIERNNAEIYAITEYLFKDKNHKISNDTPYLGDPENGQILFNAIGCMGCHKIDDTPSDYSPETKEYDFYASKHGYSDNETTNYNLLNEQGPNLIGLGSKVSGQWLYEWLKNPKNYWEKTRMPNLRLTDQEAKDITSYLLTFKNNKFENQDIPLLTEDNFQSELEDIAFSWLNTSFNYVDAEETFNDLKKNHQIIEYVADKSIRYYGCYSCHNIDGYEDAKPIGAELSIVGSKALDKFDFGHIHDIQHINFSWINQKLANPRIFDRSKVLPPEDKSRMPNFYFTQTEIEAITTALLGLTDSKLESSKLADLDKSDHELLGYNLIRQYNCYGCHEIYDEGGRISDSIKDILPEKLHAEHRNYAPPSLYSEGSKVQSDWLFNYFQAPITIRPNLQVRMPSFNLSDNDWNAIIAAFKDMEDNDLSYESVHMVDMDSDKYRQGYELASDYGYYDLEQDIWVDAFNEGSRCYVCHFEGDVPPGKDFEISNPLVWAPNLALSKERLRPEWIKEWLRNPQHYMEYTKMVAPVLYNRCPECLDGELTDIEYAEIKNISDETDNLNWRNGAEADYRLAAITDWIFSIKGQSDISNVIKDYFNQNGYKHFKEEEEDEDDW